MGHVDGKVLWGLHCSSAIQLDWSRHTLTHQYFQTDLVKGIEFKWSKGAHAQEQIQHILAFLYTLTSGIPTGQQPCAARVLPDLEAYTSLAAPLFFNTQFCIRPSERESPRICALWFRGRFTNMELVWFLSQLSNNINNGEKRMGVKAESVTQYPWIVCLSSTFLWWRRPISLQGLCNFLHVKHAWEVFFFFFSFISNGACVCYRWSGTGRTERNSSIEELIWPVI